MKSIITFAAIFIFFINLVIGQPYSEIVQVENKSADAIYLKAKEWVALNFKSANDVIQLDDAAAKKMICKGTTQIYFDSGKVKTYYYLHFTLIIEVRDGRYKQEIVPDYYTTEGGVEYSVAQMNEFTTEDGVKNYYKSMGVGAFATKKAVQDIITGNKYILAQSDAEINKKLSDLKTYITTEQASANW